jgi:hypothetical protein
MSYEIGPFDIVDVEVVEERATSGASGDGSPLGVLSAYCLGMDRCPDQVDASVEASTGG